MATQHEINLLNNLYQYYVKAKTGFEPGDQVMYIKPGTRYTNQTGSFIGTRKEDGKLKIKLGNIYLYADPRNVKNTSPASLDKLNQILKQMVAFGDISQQAVDEFLGKLNVEEEEDNIVIQKPPKLPGVKPKRSTAWCGSDDSDGCGGGGGVSCGALPKPKRRRDLGCGGGGGCGYTRPNYGGCGSGSGSSC